MHVRSCPGSRGETVSCQKVMSCRASCQTHTLLRKLPAEQEGLARSPSPSCRLRLCLRLPSRQRSCPAASLSNSVTTSHAKERGEISCPTGRERVRVPPLKEEPPPSMHAPTHLKESGAEWVAELSRPRVTSETEKAASRSLLETASSSKRANKERTVSCPSKLVYASGAVMGMTLGL